MLSNNEIMFVQQFFTPWANHLESKFLHALPGELRDLGLNKKLMTRKDRIQSKLQENMIPEPDFKEFVFFRVLKTIEHFGFDQL